MLKPISNKRHLGCEARKFPEVILQQQCLRLSPSGDHIDIQFRVRLELPLPEGEGEVMHPALASLPASRPAREPEKEEVIRALITHIQRW